MKILIVCIFICLLVINNKEKIINVTNKMFDIVDDIVLEDLRPSGSTTLYKNDEENSEDETEFHMVYL